MEADRVDRLYLFYAPTVLGAGGVPAFPGVGFQGRRVEVRGVGPDVLMIIDGSG
ncbi:MAG: hypothetical protein GWM90_33140 [Gemmatimonadetes bacterium]|nr:dihydrofolate reductase family protein [Gemmatimonadota bacterium]NIQ60166.1 dihydrofolate reductase family protein [Gemmatimonadota bacterium]NIU80382.1 hypothetical protein [Gammaproteobacteria bacterium]NIX48726.1 hypothetical protein [Gemmatimonadota bacterium]NIY13177.1 hypothetical protein [Gemmatimonadota bacterium]